MNLKNPLTVALFMPNLQGGGAERVMANIAKGLSNNGLKVDFVLAKAEGPYLESLPNSIHVIDLKRERTKETIVPLSRYLKERKPEVLISALHQANLAAILANSLASFKGRIFISVHSQMSKEIEYTKGLNRTLVPFLAKIFYPKAEKIICVSYGIAKELINTYHLPKDKVQVIYNPVVTADIFEKAEKPIDHPWFQLGQPPVILGAGRLTPAKDFGTLIKAFDIVRKVRPARLLILGEGPERENLEGLIKDLNLENDVAMPGFVENPYKYMKSSAVFVLSSRWEGLPTVLIEALAVGVPVVSTNCPSGPAEILENGKWGRLVPVGDPKALADAIIEAMDDERGKGIERAKDFSLDKIVDQYLALIYEVEKRAEQ
ncbi:MAG TPA: glycosyltransferase [Bacillota bacterium]|nr:glycosyltransferase [Bacillota bacterium]HPQ10746.1 glycosyltransferase [Bacillota bacterium]